MEKEFKFHAEDKKLSDVLFSQKKYRIPRYQRPYAWGIEQISEFWDDLVANDEPYFLGSFIFNTEQESSTGFTDIIDGQQRLVTVTILISVLRDLAKPYDPDTAGRYQRQDIAIENRDGSMSFRIVPSESIVEYYRNYIQAGNLDIQESFPETKEESRVKENRNFLYSKLDDELVKIPSAKDKLYYLDKIRKKVSDLVVIVVEISREEDAYEIFETTNARGIDLSVGDLLKNFIFKKVQPGENKDTAKDIWNDIVVNIEATDTEIKRFIRYYWISKYSFVTEKRLFKEIKNRIDNWSALLHDIRDASIHYNKLLNGVDLDFSSLRHGRKIYEAVFAIRLMGVSQCYVLLLSILKNMDRLGTDPLRVFQLVEKFTFQYSVVCKLPANRVEKIYSKYALRLEETLNNNPAKKIPGRVQALFAELEGELKHEAPSEILFKESYRELSYRNSDQMRRLVKYMLARIDSYYGNGDEHLINFANVNIEHLLPQNPHKDWGLDKRDIRHYVNRLGNLTLISKKINSKVQNKLILEKIPDLEKSQLPITKNVVETLNELGHIWGEAQIVARQEKLAEISYRDIWAL